MHLLNMSVCFFPPKFSKQIAVSKARITSEKKRKKSMLIHWLHDACQIFERSFIEDSEMKLFWHRRVGPLLKGQE